jgi:hypothetical protein
VTAIAAPELEAIGAAWWSALDAADTAAHAARASLEPPELAVLGARLAAERTSTVHLLEDVARDEGVRADFSNVLVSRASLRSLRRTFSPAAASHCRKASRSCSNGTCGR